MSYRNRNGRLWAALDAQRSAASARAARGSQRSAYAGADASRLTSSWSGAPLHVNRALYADLKTLRARSRDLKRSNGYAKKFIALVKNNVVGHAGFGLQVQALRRDKSIDEKDSSACEDAFADWALPGNCEVTGKLSFVDFQRLWIETVAVDGEVLVREHARGPYNYQLELIDVALLDERLNQDLANGNKVRMGVEYDRWHAPVAYWLSKSDSADPTNWGYFGASDYERVPADQIRHDFLVEMVGQLRGEPWMTPALDEVHHLRGYKDAAVVAARVGAAQGGFFTTQEDAAGLADTIVDEGGENEQLEMEVEPGVFRMLPKGTSFEKFDPTYPHQMFDAFVKTCLRGIATAWLTPYNDLASDLEGVNFSSIRDGKLEQRDVWKGLQGWMSGGFLRHVYKRWLPRAIVSSQLLLPFDKLAKYERAIWQGRRWDWIDPEKDVKALVLACQNGLKSYSSAIREQGRDPEEVWRELERDRTRLKALGLNLDGAAKAAPSALGESDVKPEGNAGEGGG